MKRRQIWTGFSSLMTFLLIVAIIGMNCMMGYSGTINSELGISTSKVVNPEGTDLADAQFFESGYGELNADNLQKVIAETYNQSVSEQEEGSVLLKNSNKALPLSDKETNVTLFGHAVAQPLYKAASAGSKGYQSEYNIDLYHALKEAGMTINDVVYDSYVASETVRGTGAYDFASDSTSKWSMGEEELSFYTDELKASWENDYNDVAIVMLAREGGEGVELQTKTESEGISQLALTKEEKDLLQLIKNSKQFAKTIVLINSGWAMELAWLDEYDVDACLWIGAPGQRGFEGVANLLTGKANPSGKLTDTYAVNSLSSPAVVNGSYNNQQWTNLVDVVKATNLPEEDMSYYSIQAEGIYVGYKYYETRYEDAILAQGNATTIPGSSTKSAWEYQAEVSYPFGYGLSYTNFKQTLDKVKVEDDKIIATVTVKNTGDVSGKSVVQLYAQTPYGEYEKANKVEKSAIQLLNFGKTASLEPGQAETLTIECDKYLLASYDYTKEKGYIFSEGDYYLALGDDAHDALNHVLSHKNATGMVDSSGATVSGEQAKAYKWSEKFDANTYKTSQYSDEIVTNQFDESDINYWLKDAVTYVSRRDWETTYPTKATQVAANEKMIEMLKGFYYEKASDSPSIETITTGDNQNIPLAAMIGLEADNPKWEAYLNQYTLEELASLVADNFGTAEVPSVGKPAVMAGDGPDGPGGTFNKDKYGDGRQDTCFPSEIVLASTFNKELMESRGELMGEESLYLGISQVWMPGANLHRTPFGGRNFEYYSEDGVMTYLCTIPEVEGIESKGVHAGPKHLVGNDQENNREGLSVFFNEQALREGSLRGFEGALAEAGAMTVMHGFNRLGMVWCSTSEALVTQVLENEWGFVGQQETDAIAGSEGYKSDYATALAVGTDTFCLDFSGVSSRTIASTIKDNDDGYLLGKLRDSAQDYLYTVANSSVMNGYTKDSKVVSVTPWWQPTMYAAIGVFAILLAVGLFFLTRSKRDVAIVVEEEE